MGQILKAAVGNHEQEFIDITDSQLDEIRDQPIDRLRESAQLRAKSLRNKSIGDTYTFKGYKWYTDRDSINDVFMVLNAHLSLGGSLSDPAPNWKTAYASFATDLTYQDFKDFLKEVRTHIQEKYDKEAVLLNKINKMTKSELKSVDLVEEWENV